MRKIDINVDLAEGFSFDDELLEIATSANVCCGAHAGSVELSLATIQKCRGKGVRVGAHPGVPDRKNFGRLPLVIEHGHELDALLESLVEQLSIAAWAYVKPHGALYNATNVPGLPAQAVAALMRSHAVPLFGMPGTHHEEIARSAGVALIREGFADRLYLDNGLLAPRSVEGSVLSDPEQISKQVIELAEKVDSICIHGDSPGCVAIAELVRKTLEDAGHEVGH